MRRLLEQQATKCDYFREALIIPMSQTSFGVRGVYDT